MSRAFVKEHSDSDRPVVRGTGGGLPPGTPNLATPWSAAELAWELAGFVTERSALRCATTGVAIARASTLDAEIRSLEGYLPTIQMVAPPEVPTRVGFATAVAVNGAAGTRTVLLVGGDEARPTDGRISFFSPLARALIGATVGDTVTVVTPSGDEDWEVVTIAPAAPPGRRA